MANKYGNARPKYKGKRFDSGIEMLRYRHLLAQEKKGAISDLRRQVRYTIIPKQDGESAAAYVADFVYNRGGVEVVEDVKGYRTDLYILKRKMMLYNLGIRIHEVENAADPLGGGMI